MWIKSGSGYRTVRFQISSESGSRYGSSGSSVGDQKLKKKNTAEKKIQSDSDTDLFWFKLGYQTVKPGRSQKTKFYIVQGAIGRRCIK